MMQKMEMVDRQLAKRRKKSQDHESNESDVAQKIQRLRIQVFYYFDKHERLVKWLKALEITSKVYLQGRMAQDLPLVS